MFFAKHVVVDVVSRCNLEATCTKFDVNIFVFNNGDAATHDGDNNALALQPFVLGVVGVDAHCSVAHDGFGACGCNDCIASFGIAFNHIAEVVEL